MAVLSTHEAARARTNMCLKRAFSWLHIGAWDLIGSIHPSQVGRPGEVIKTKSTIQLVKLLIEAVQITHLMLLTG